MRLARALALILALVPGALAATPAHAAQSEAVKAEKERLKDDKADLKAIEKLRDKWSKARKKGDHKTEHKVDAELIPWLKAEVEESEAELALVIDETGAPPTSSGSPVRLAGTPPPPPPRSTDKRVNRSMDEVERLKAIRKELRELLPAFDSEIADAGQYERKQALLDELVDMARGELTRQERRLEGAKGE